MCAIPIGLHLTAVVGQAPHGVRGLADNLTARERVIDVVQLFVVNHTLNIIGSLGVVKGRLHDPFDFRIFVI